MSSRERAGSSILSLLGTVALAVVIAVLLWKNFFPGVLGKLSLALILSGAVGNLIDRVLLGFVTDMFMTTFINFAVFNVADVFIVGGGIMCIIYFLFMDDKLRGAEKNEPNDA